MARPLFAALLLAGPAVAAPLNLAGLAKVATVSDRYQSYNIEMVEVTGGRFWAPYGGPPNERYRQRPALDLADPRLLALARHLAPAYVRVSGTWSNNSYLPAAGETVTAPPAGFVQVLQRDQWKGVVAFAKAADARIVTSFAASTGTRGPDGVWRPEQAQRLLDLTREAGGSIAAAEFFNEPDMPAAAPGMPSPYTAADYGRDFRIFHDWVRKSAPNLLILGPGSVTDGMLSRTAGAAAALGGKRIASADMLAANPGGIDALSYHFYGSVSQRCAGLGIGTADRAAALSDAWLDRTLADYQVYADLRDAHAPGKPIWNTETAQAACGGSPWASGFVDSFRYLNQLAVLAQRGVQVVAHNTLAASDYALVDGDTLTPRPNYWAAVLWRRLMGTTVLASPAGGGTGLRLYAHCLAGKPGGVALLALNTGSAPRPLPVAGGQAWVMTAANLDAGPVRINGTEPGLTADGAITGLDAVAVTGGALTLPPQAIAFVAVADAGNRACR